MKVFLSLLIGAVMFSSTASASVFPISLNQSPVITQIMGMQTISTSLLAGTLNCQLRVILALGGRNAISP